LRRTALALATAAVLVLAFGIAGCGSAGASSQPKSTAASAAGRPAGGGPVVGVTGARFGQALPAGFVGMSIEERALEQFAGADPKALDPVFVHLLQDIAPQQSPVLRVAGDSTDWSWWPVPRTARPPGVKYDLSPTWMSVAHALAAQLRARLILGVNLEADSRAVATAEAGAMLGRIGRPYIDALELGNEPELYGSFGWYRSPLTHQQVPGRPRGYSFASFVSDFARFSSYLRGDPLAGPSIGGPAWLQSLGSFVNAEHRLSVVTVHAYPLKHCTKSTVITSGQLLANSSSHGLAQRVAPWVALSARHHLPLRVDEMNGISCGGTRGVSDTFTSALWLLDTLFEMDRTGVAGVNIHTVPNTINEVLGPQFANGKWSMRVHPEFYGMVMFAQAAPAGSHLLRVSAKLPSGIKVWATRARTGAVHVVVINKRLSGAQTVRLRIAGATGTASVEQLQATNVHATSGVTLGGQTFGAATSTGLLSGPPAGLTVAPAGGTYSVRVPAASATMLSLP
jgi:Glycosyl hydrolase family 79 C-terminal beta domain